MITRETFVHRGIEWTVTLDTFGEAWYHPTTPILGVEPEAVIEQLHNPTRLHGRFHRLLCRTWNRLIWADPHTSECDAHPRLSDVRFTPAF